MEGSSSMSLERHEYRLKQWGQALYLGLGICVGGGGFYVTSGITGGGAQVGAGKLASLLSAVQPAMPAIFILIGVYYAAVALRSRVVLDGTRISLRYAIREKSADLSEIEGWRMDQTTRNGPYWRIELKEGRGHLSIMTMFQVDDGFYAFLSQLKNLDNG